MDSSRQEARISVSMADVGSAHLSVILDSITHQVNKLFPKEKYDVQLTGTSILSWKGAVLLLTD
ncbi:MAG: hypothetical protein WDO71_27610 [Bacteroidota bacterium]